MPRAQAACEKSPEGEIEVVSNNVYETEKADARKPGDMRRFVDRMAEMVPTAPDIVLVQEVRKVAVGNIKNYLTNKFGCTFVIPVNASKTGWRYINANRLIGQDTAVIVNSSSMAVEAKGFVANDYDLSLAASGTPVKVKKAAWVKVAEKDVVPGSGPDLLKVAAASAHYPRASHFKNSDVAARLAAVFSENIATKLSLALPDDSRSDHKFHVLGGDLNTHRYVDSASNPTPMYKLMTTAPLNYKDPVIEMVQSGSPNPIDFLFTDGNGIQAQEDKNNTHNESSSDFYSNHDLRWAMIEGPDGTAPTRPGDIPSKQGYGTFIRIWGWDRSRDGGTGFAGYTVYRREAGRQDWTAMVTGLMETDFRDETVEKGELYEYKVTASDNVKNESSPNATLQIRAGS